MAQNAVYLQMSASSISRREMSFKAGGDPSRILLLLYPFSIVTRAYVSSTFTALWRGSLIVRRQKMTGAGLSMARR